MLKSSFPGNWGGGPFEGQEFCVPKTTIHLQSFLWILIGHGC